MGLTKQFKNGTCLIGTVTYDEMESRVKSVIGIGMESGMAYSTLSLIRTGMISVLTFLAL